MQTPISDKPQREVRCPECRKLIFKEQIIAGKIEIDCPRCKKKSTIRFKFLDIPSNREKLNRYIIGNMMGGEQK